MRKVTEELYVGGLEDAFNVLMRRGGFKHIKSVLQVNWTGLPTKRGIVKLVLPFRDGGGDHFPLSAFDLGTTFLDLCEKPVLVNCDAGVSRSTCMAAAWLWQLHRDNLALGYIPVEEAVDRCESEIAPPNRGMLNKLDEWTAQRDEACMPRHKGVKMHGRKCTCD